MKLVRFGLPHGSHFNITVTTSIDGSGSVFLTGIFNFTPLYEQID